MIVEFMGCTGAGKTTLAVDVVDRLRDAGWPVQDHCNRRSSFLVSLAHAVVAPLHLVPLAFGGSTHRRCLALTWRAIRRSSRGAFWSMARTWSLIRILGTHIHRMHTKRARIRIVDEGVLGIVCQAFDRGETPKHDEVESFVAAIPPPDVIVWVDAPLEALLDRTLLRSDAPREWRHRTAAELRVSLAQLSNVFRVLADAQTLRGRVIRAWNPPATPRERAALAERIAADLRPRMRNLHFS